MIARNPVRESQNGTIIIAKLICKFWTDKGFSVSILPEWYQISYPKGIKAEFKAKETDTIKGWRIQGNGRKFLLIQNARYDVNGCGRHTNFVMLDEDKNRAYFLEIGVQGEQGNAIHRQLDPLCFLDGDILEAVADSDAFRVCIALTGDVFATNEPEAQKWIRLRNRRVKNDLQKITPIFLGSSETSLMLENMAGFFGI